jgi:hypothetical protein
MRAQDLRVLAGMSEKVAHYVSGRWRFGGKRDVAVEELYVWRDVSHYLPNGGQNPIRYDNC